LIVTTLNIDNSDLIVGFGLVVHTLNVKHICQCVNIFVHLYFIIFTDTKIVPISPTQQKT
jgi:hypothetical protein